MFHCWFGLIFIILCCPLFVVVVVVWKFIKSFNAKMLFLVLGNAKSGCLIILQFQVHHDGTKAFKIYSLSVMHWIRTPDLWCRIQQTTQPIVPQPLPYPLTHPRAIYLLFEWLSSKFFKSDMHEKQQLVQQLRQGTTTTVWPDWAIFESSQWQIIVQK